MHFFFISRAVYRKNRGLGARVVGWLVGWMVGWLVVVVGFAGGGGIWLPAGVKPSSRCRLDVPLKSIP
jgi:hypothetical protein